VKQAKVENYRARSAFKLIELDDKYHFLKPSSIVIDCGACPGSWSQVAAERTRSEELEGSQLVTMSQGAVIAIDIQDIEPIPGVITLNRYDFMSPETKSAIKSVLKGFKADVVMSDMAPNASGLQQVDHEQIVVGAHIPYKFLLRMVYSA
jgi:23S rRNA (uridine2552-2'-O)-methyltransferase